MKSPLMTLPLFFLLIAAALCAPHLTWPSARVLALVSIGCAVVLFLVVMCIGPR